MENQRRSGGIRRNSEEFTNWKTEIWCNLMRVTWVVTTVHICGCTSSCAARISKGLLAWAEFSETVTLLQPALILAIWVAGKQDCVISWLSDDWGSNDEGSESVSAYLNYQQTKGTKWTSKDFSEQEQTTTTAAATATATARYQNGPRWSESFYCSWKKNQWGVGHFCWVLVWSHWIKYWNYMYPLVN